LLAHLANDSYTNFATLFRHICALNNKHISVINSIINISPSEGARLWLKSELLTARLSGGNTIEVFPCIEIPSNNLTFLWNHTINNTCFLHTPVMFNNITFFIDNKELIRTSKIIDCSAVPLTLFWSNNTILNNKNRKLNISLISSHLSFNFVQNTRPFAAKSIFSDSLSVISSLNLLMNFANRLNKKLPSPPIYSSQSVNSILENLSKITLPDVQQVMSDIKEKVSFSFFGWIEDLQKILLIILAFAAPVLIIAGLFVAYPYCAPLLSRQQNVAAIGPFDDAIAIHPSAPPMELLPLHFNPPSHNYFPPIYSINLFSRPKIFPLIVISLNGSNTVAIVDTGSAISFLPAHLLDHIASLPFTGGQIVGTCAKIK
jgi:hypothetical protein